MLQFGNNHALGLLEQHLVIKNTKVFSKQCSNEIVTAKKSRVYNS